MELHNSYTYTSKYTYIVHVDTSIGPNAHAYILWNCIFHTHIRANAHTPYTCLHKSDQMRIHFLSLQGGEDPYDAFSL